MPQPRHQLSTAELTLARRRYEAGASFRELAAEHGMSHATMRLMLRAVGVQSRAQGFQRCQPVQPTPPPRPATAIVSAITSDATGRLRIPVRTPAERAVRWWTPPERRAIEQALRAGLAQRAAIGRLGLPERPSIRASIRARISFYVAMRGVQRAA